MLIKANFNFQVGIFIKESVSVNILQNTMQLNTFVFIEESRVPTCEMFVVHCCSIN